MPEGTYACSGRVTEPHTPILHDLPQCPLCLTISYARVAESHAKGFVTLLASETPEARAALHNTTWQATLSNLYFIKHQDKPWLTIDPPTGPALAEALQRLNEPPLNNPLTKNHST